MENNNKIFFVTDQKINKSIKVIFENNIIYDNKDVSFSIIKYRKMSNEFKKKPWVFLKKYLGVELNIFQKFYLFLMSFKS